MLVGRESELLYLQQFFEKQENQLLIVYGQKNVGKTSLLLHFARNHPYFYYLAQPCSESRQKLLWQKQLPCSEEIKHLFSYDDLLQYSVPVKKEKAVIIVDEFQSLVKNGKEFMYSIVSYIRNSPHKVMVILASSSISWIENSMISKLGTSAYAISAFYKIRELSFQNVRSLFPAYNLKNCLILYSITGGNPGLLTCMNQDVTMETNICECILESNSPLKVLGRNILTEELRETTIYNTILEALTLGKNKLNDLFLSTGFSRPKLSVYIKNLIELELVEKVFSYDTDGRENTKKGVYRICNHFTYFWYQFIFPNEGRLEQLPVKEFYDTCIGPYLQNYTTLWYPEVCVEYLYQLDAKQQLPVSGIVKRGEWVGKEGTIDAILEDKEGHTITAFCHYNSALTTYEDYEQNISCIKQAKLQADYIYLFTFRDFDERVVQESKMKNNIILIPFRQMFTNPGKDD